MQNGYSFVSGYDLVNEEDRVNPILHFVEDILEAQQKYPDFKLYLHSGETASRHNENLYDAVLLGTKRIAHGLVMNLHPYL